MAFNFKGLIEPLAIRFLGPPNKSRSTATELRYGTNGSVNIDKDKDTFFNHEGGFGGGVVEFVRWQVRDNDPMDWLKHEYPERCDPSDRPRRSNSGDHNHSDRAPLGPLIATFTYRDESGTPLFDVLKYGPPKDFRQRAADGSWKVRGIRQVPYRLPELIAAIAARKRIWVVEGEKDVDRMRAEGKAATCNVGGAGKWRNELSHYFHGAVEVIAVADNDPQATKKNPDGTEELLWHEDGRPKLPGQDHANDVCKSLKPIVAKVRLLDLGKQWPECPSKGDISNFFDAGHTLEELIAIADALPDWQPQKWGGIGATVKPLGSSPGPATAAPSAPASLSDDDLAEAFMKAHGDDFAYLENAKQWRRWDGTRWLDCANVSVEKSLGAWLRTDVKPDVKKMKDRMRIGAQSTISAVTSRLRALLLVPEDVFDRSPWLLNTPGGTIDLHWEGGMTAYVPRPHNREDYLTKVAAVAPGGDCPQWLTFVDFVTNGDKDLATYLQKLAGYALVGVPDEQMFAFLYGSGNNGKSVFLQTLLFVLGEYGVTVNAEVFLWSAIPRHPEELMALRGARLVLASEIPKDARWNEGRLKNLTGGEKTRARGMYANSIEFLIEATLIIAGNDKPHMKGVDAGMTRRLHLVPFTAVVGPEMRDKGMLEKLKAEAPGILTWMLEGCHQWQVEGLERTERVLSATEEYIADEDYIHQWLDECTIESLGANTALNMLFKSWKAWAEDAGLKAGRAADLSARLSAMGYDKARHAKGIVLTNLAIRPQDDLWDQR